MISRLVGSDPFELRNETAIAAARGSGRRHISHLVVTVLAVSLFVGAASAQSESTTADVETFFSKHVLTMALDEEVMADMEEQARQSHFDGIEYLKSTGAWSELSEEDRAAREEFVYEPYIEFIEILPEIGLLTMASGTFSMPRIQRNAWRVVEDEDGLAIIMGDATGEHARAPISFFDGNRIEMQFSERGEEQTLAFVALSDSSSDARDRDAARMAGVWKLVALDDQSLAGLPPLVYDFAQDATLEVRAEGEWPDSVSMMGEMPSAGRWQLSVSRAKMYDPVKDELFDGRMLILSSAETGPHLFTITHLADDSLVLRSDGMMGLPTMTFSR